MMMGELLDEQELSETFKIPRRTLQRWRVDGRGPSFVRLGRRRVAYRRSDIERWLDERTYKTTADEYAALAAARQSAGPTAPKVA